MKEQPGFIGELASFVLDLTVNIFYYTLIET